MTVTSNSQTESVLVAIDISKARHEVLIAVPGKKRRRRLTVLSLDGLYIKMEEFWGHRSISNSTLHWPTI